MIFWESGGTSRPNVAATFIATLLPNAMGVWTALIDIILGELLCNSAKIREELHNKAASDVSDFLVHLLLDRSLLVKVKSERPT